MIIWHSWTGFAVATLIAIAAALIVIAVVSLSLRATARRKDWAKVLAGGARHPFRLTVLIIAVWFAVGLDYPDPTWRGHLVHGLQIALIAAVAWLVSRLITFAIGLGMRRYRTDVPDNRLARRAQTQLAIVRRLATVIVVVIGIGAILLTFPGVQAVGTSVLASAGVISVIAGLAAQSTLGNVFAGVQLAFSDAIRVDDVVVVQGQWGRIEEITLTYVVVHVWDDRRLVLPSTYFTTTPFENWTRSTSELLGAVEFDLDWRVNPVEMRAELERILGRTALWDRRASVLQVTDAVGGFVHVRVLVTAVDAPTLFDLRCFVREGVVDWIQRQDPTAMPRTRVVITADEEPDRPHTRPSTETGSTGLFTGDAEAEQRAKNFTTSMPIVVPVPVPPSAS
ncbi:mechanosensitive ion channel family protein [Galbitalea soli]|uniref:mechanosensitive ion channel family protein n=1 Tax=Galbitalea soli TaxID=1268042 RepID=UPI0017933DE8|nr:small-conductance mechanosensitive channel [Galbitalea soli]